TGPEYRPDNYHKLTFSMMYYYNERYLLPLSHDEVVHGKATITQKMHGDYEGKFPQARAMYLYMMVHPGKKLNFMGNEIGQLREWDEKRQQDWDLRSYPVHDAFYRYMSELNHQYLAHPALWEGDYDGDGFQWVDCHQEFKSVYVIQRKSSQEILVALFNFSACPQEYELPGMKEKKGEPEILLNSDWTRFGGTADDDTSVYRDGTFFLPPFCGMLVKP
ncbi:MAG: alpha amylase C-terminal domain-containing protein, partial [Lachnospiraceae bacterium]|nr:alpha amylase C-terminal domain-containing protein [Lachnospiraceae bacterium]